MGIAIALNGLASYASDVVYLGEPVNPWKRVDLVLATANTGVQERAAPSKAESTSGCPAAHAVALRGWPLRWQ